MAGNQAGKGKKYDSAATFLGAVVGGLGAREATEFWDRKKGKRKEEKEEGEGYKRDPRYGRDEGYAQDEGYTRDEGYARDEGNPRDNWHSRDDRHRHTPASGQRR